MSALPISHVLVDLGSDAGRSAKSRVLPELSSETERRANIEERVADARMTGFAEGQGAERAILEAKLAEQAAAFERKLVAERQKWVAEEGEQLAARILSAAGEAERRIADTLARLLKPVLAASVERRAVSGLLEIVDGVLSRGEVTRLTVSAPEDLLERLRECLADKIERVTFVASTGCDVSVMADETTFETRIGDWSRAIAGES